MERDICATIMLPQEKVRRVVEKHYNFASVVKELAGNIRSESGRMVDMSAIRDALLMHVDLMIQEDESNRFETPRACQQSPMNLQAANMVLNMVQNERCAAFAIQ